MEKCNDLYKKLQQDVKNFQVIIKDQDLLNDENMTMFCLNIIMKQDMIKAKNKEFFNDEYIEIGNKWEDFDEKIKKTIWLYFDLFVKLCEKYTKKQMELNLNTKNIDISSKLSEVSSVLEEKMGIKMNTGMEEMVDLIAKEVQKELKKGNTNMQGIIKNVMERVIHKFKNKIESGEIDVEDLKQSTEKLMKQIGNPVSLFGLGSGNGVKLSHNEKRKARRERLKKRLEDKQLNKQK